MTDNIQIVSNNIPERRFQEFSGEWKERKLSDLTDIYDGTHQTPKYVKKGIPFYSVEHITSNNFTDTKFIAPDIFENENRRVQIMKGDILMTRIGDIGTARLIDWDVTASFYVSLALIKQSSAFNSRFLAQLMHSVSFQRQLWKRTIHVAFPKKINLGEIGECKFYSPSKDEQQKIADFLSTADDWIENLRAQKEHLEQYKKGIMQKIFSQEIRFKDESGNNFPEWIDKKLSDTGDIITGTTPSTLNKEYYGGNIPWITPTDISMQKDIYTSMKLLTEIGMQKSRYVAKNSLLVTCIASIGKNAILRVAGSCNQQINAITPNKYNDVEFLYYLLEQYKNILIRYAGAGGMQMLNKKDFSSLEFKIPILTEQQKIADFISLIDNLIQHKDQQISHVELWKKGLIHQMFV